MRRVVATTIAASVMVACSGGSSDDSADITTTAPTSATEADEAPTSTATTTTTTPSAPTAESAYDQLQLLAADESVSDLDLALVELSAIVGPIPGVPALLDDDSIYPSLTHVMLEIETERDALTDEQAAAVDEGLATVFPPDQIIDEFALFTDADDPGEAEGFAPQGFASSVAGPPTDEASPELRAAADPASGHAASPAGFVAVG